MSLEKSALDTPLSNQKVQEWAKLEVKLRDYGMRQAVDALRALVHDRPLTLPGLPWLRSGWTVDRADRGDSGKYVCPHLPASSWKLFAGDKPVKKR